MRYAFLAAALCAAPAARADFIDLYANTQDVPENKAPRVGNSNVVVIPVQVDFGNFHPIDMDRLHVFFEGAHGTTDLTFRRYYETASNGRYHPTVTVAPLVEYASCPSMIHTSGCTIPRGDVSSLSQGVDFIRDVIKRSHDENKVDFSKFDVNGMQGGPDGTVDGVMILVNVPGVGIALPIEYVNSGSDLNGGTGGAFVLDGVRIPYISLGSSEYVLLHEFGHLLGLADLYYEHPSAGDKYPNWGGLHFSLMGDYGYTADVALPDAESRRALGWQPHLVVSGTQSITLAPAGAGGLSVKLGMMNDAHREYFLAEARGPAQGVDTGVKDGKGNPAWGLAVYHVDWSKGPKPDTGEWTSRLIYCLDCDPFHPFVGNVESSGGFLLVNNGAQGGAQANATPGVADDMVLFRGGALQSVDNAQPLSPTNRYVASNYYDGTPSGISIRDITVNADHSVTATFTAPAVDDPCADVRCAALEQCITTGTMAGNCAALEVALPDAGPTPVPTPSPGCSTAGAPGFAGGLLLALLGLAAVRRRTQRR